MYLRPPSSTRTGTLFPCTPLCRSLDFVAMRLGALGQAEQFLRKAIAGGATDFETRRNLASVLSQQDRPEQAIPMFEILSRESAEPGLKAVLAGLLETVEIGRASCRERVCQYV